MPEYAREYINKLDHPYKLTDIENIARGQLKKEKEKEQKVGEILFCDTELIVCKIWAEYKYDQCPEWILKNIASNRYDLILLTNIDLPWQSDPQREHPDKRQFFFGWFEKELQTFGSNYHIVSGRGEQRLENAIRIVEKFGGF